MPVIHGRSNIKIFLLKYFSPLLKCIYISVHCLVAVIEVDGDIYNS